MNSKSKLLLFLLFLSMLLQTGCWSKTELTRLAIVVGFGVDVDNNDKIEVCLQIVKPSSESSGKSQGGGGQGKQYVVVTSQGDTIFEAVRNLVHVVDREVFYSNVNVIIIGEKLAKKGIKEVLDLFERQTQTPPKAKILVSQGCSVKDILDTESEFENLPSVSLYNIEDNFRSAPSIAEETLHEMLQEIKKTGLDITLGRVSKKNDKKVSVEGAAVFRGEKLVGWLDKELTEGYRFAKGDVQSAIKDFKSPFGGKTIISLENVSSKSKIKVEWEDEKPKFIIHISQSGSIAEINSDLSLMGKGKIKGLEDSFSKATAAYVNNLISFVKKNGTDLLGLGNILYKFHYNYSKSVSKNWASELAKVPMEVKVTSTIERAGFINR